MYSHVLNNYYTPRVRVFYMNLTIFTYKTRPTLVLAHCRMHQLCSVDTKPLMKLRVGLQTKANLQVTPPLVARLSLTTVVRWFVEVCISSWALLHVVDDRDHANCLAITSTRTRTYISRWREVWSGILIEFRTQTLNTITNIQNNYVTRSMSTDTVR